MRSANKNQNQYERSQCFTWFSCLHQGLWSFKWLIEDQKVGRCITGSAWKHETGICHWQSLAGKTSTLKSLCNEAFDASEASTHGVENAVCTTDSWLLHDCEVVQGCARLWKVNMCVDYPDPAVSSCSHLFVFDYSKLFEIVIRYRMQTERLDVLSLVDRWFLLDRTCIRESILPRQVLQI